MLNKISVNLFLKSALGLMAAVAVVTLAVNSVVSWQRYQDGQLDFQVAEASSPIFVALHTTRLDRSTTFRDLQSDRVGSVSAITQDIRARELKALNEAVDKLAKIDFPQGKADFASLRSMVEQLQGLQQRANAALGQPKAERPAGLAAEYSQRLSGISDLLERISTQLSVLIRLDDPLIDQLFMIKDLAWIARNTAGGDASVMISNAVGGMSMPPDVMQRYAVEMARGETAWISVGAVMAGLKLPERMTAAKATADKEFFAADYLALRLRMLTKALAKESLDMPAAQWLPNSIAKNSLLLAVAEEAMEYAREHAAAQSASAGRALIVQLSFLLVAMALSAFLMVTISRRVIQPLTAIQSIMGKIADGEFTVSMPETGRADEIGKIVSSVNAMIDRVGTTIATVKNSAREVTNASGEIATATSDLSQRTEEQAASLEETSASMEEISVTVKKNAESAEQANKSAATTRQVASRGSDVVAQAVNAMARIEDSSRKISDIIGVIDEIARQTNLLALNAAVEAARAGEAGRGFAVVASEVRSLAQRSSQAAKDIKDLITSSNGQVKDGVDLVNRAGVALSEIVESINAVATIVSDIAAASTAQATGIDEINRALAQMDDATQQNSALVEENAATAKTLEQQATSMSEQVAYFQTTETEAPVAVREPVAPKAPVVSIKPRSKAA